MSETTRPTVSEFLLARFAEDERLARDAERTWSQVRIHYGTSASPEQRLAREAFVLNINPWRVLADIEAKRRIVQDHSPRPEYLKADITVCGVCVETHSEDGYCENQRYPCRTLRALALPYAGHADYRQEWKP